MYAVMEDRGKQYKVSVGEEIAVDFMDSEPGATLDFGRVLLLGSPTGAIRVGSPTVEGANVVARVLGETKGPKVVSYTLRRRKNSRRKVGHRQRLMRLRITKIQAPA